MNETVLTIREGMREALTIISLDPWKKTRIFDGTHVRCSSQGVLGEFGMIVVCSVRAGGEAERGRGR